MHQLLEQFRHFIQHWLETGGYVAVFSVLFLCGLGLPVPEDIPLVFSGIMIAHGRFHVAIVAIVAWCGIIGGDICLYHIGKKFGREVTRLPLIGRHVSEQRMDQVTGLYERYGIWVVAFGRMIALVRGAMVVVAGATRFNFWKFLIADGLAAIVSGGLFVLLGYWGANKVEEMKHNVHEAEKWITIIAIVAVAGIGVWIWLHRRRRAARSHPTPPAGEPIVSASNGSPADRSAGVHLPVRSTQPSPNPEA